MSELVDMRSNARDVDALKNLVDFVCQNARGKNRLTMVEIGSY